MPVISSHLEVLNLETSIDVNNLHPSNIDCKSSDELVSKLERSIEVKEEQYLNILDRFIA